jgi:hypothetical protein
VFQYCEYAELAKKEILHLVASLNKGLFGYSKGFNKKVQLLAFDISQRKLVQNRTALPTPRGRFWLGFQNTIVVATLIPQKGNSSLPPTNRDSKSVPTAAER